eukprot:scaffold70730_cov18-Tisochrysis_lutea.AAC.6
MHLLLMLMLTCSPAQAGWKMLGDVQLQHSTITPLTHDLKAELKAQQHDAHLPSSPATPSLGASATLPHPAAHSAAPAPDVPGCPATVEGIIAALGARLARVKAAGHAYAHALRLDPTQGVSLVTLLHGRERAEMDSGVGASSEGF